MFVKIKEKVDINIIDDKVRKLNDDFSKLFAIKNHYPNLLLKINRILLVLGEDKISKIYELVKYIANIETSKINNFQLISTEKISNNDYYSDYSNQNEIFEEFKDYEKIKSFKNKDSYQPISLSNTGYTSDFQRNYNCVKNSVNKNQYNYNSFGNNESNLNASMLNIKVVKDKNDYKGKLDSNINMKSQEKNLNMNCIKDKKFANKINENDSKNAPIISNEKFEFKNNKGNFDNFQSSTNCEFTDFNLITNEKSKKLKELENLKNNFEGNKLIIY